MDVAPFADSSNAGIYPPLKSGCPDSLSMSAWRPVAERAVRSMTTAIDPPGFELQTGIVKMHAGAQPKCRLISGDTAKARELRAGTTKPGVPGVSRKSWKQDANKKGERRLTFAFQVQTHRDELRRRKNDYGPGMISNTFTELSRTLPST